MILSQEQQEALYEKFPVIEFGGNYVLRELDPLDAMDLLHYLSDPEVHRYISEEDTPRTMEEAQVEVRYWSGLFKQRRSIYWAIALKETNQCIGTCGFNVFTTTHARGELSYDLAKEYWGKGIMTAALREVIRYGFEQLQCDRIQATVVTSNKASIRVLQKLGLKYEGILKNYCCLRGKFFDSNMMAITPEDYAKQQRKKQKE